MDTLEYEGDAEMMHLADCGFQVKQRDSNNYHRDDVRNQEDSATVFVDKVGKPPKRTKANRQPHHT